MKPLPEHLKYAYLDDAHKLLVIISRSLSLDHEDKLLLVLRGQKKLLLLVIIILPWMHVWIASLEFLTDALRLTLFLTLKNVILWSMKV